MAKRTADKADESQLSEAQMEAAYRRAMEAQRVQDGNKTAVYWHFAGFLPKMRGLSFAHQQTVGQLACEYAQRDPLHLTAKWYAITPFGNELTGLQVIALMVCSLWVILGESPRMAAGLLTNWPDVPLYALLSDSDGTGSQGRDADTGAGTGGA